MKKLLLFMILLLAGFVFGVGSWRWYRQHNNKVGSVLLDESLAPGKPHADTDQSAAQDEQVLANILDEPAKGLTDLPVEKFQPPFTRPTCYLSSVNTCFVSIYQFDIPSRYVVRQGYQAENKSLDKPDLTFTMGRILGEPDQVRQFFTRNDGALESYFAFVRHLRVVSLENHVNPAVVYSFYDYLLLIAEQSDKPLSTLPNPQQFAGQINMNYSSGVQEEKLRDTVSNQFARLENWTPEDKALATGLARSLNDVEMITMFFNQPGNFENYYFDRIQSDFDNKPFEVVFSKTVVTEENYRLGKQKPDSLAVCNRKEAALCNFSVSDGGGIWKLDCQPSPFLNDFCDGTLINI